MRQRLSASFPLPDHQGQVQERFVLVVDLVAVQVRLDLQVLVANLPRHPSSLHHHPSLQHWELQKSFDRFDRPAV
jgi:hypothetical protein